MRSTAVYLAIDLGTSAVKVAFVNREGRTIGGATIEYPLTILPNGWVECDPETYWSAIVRACRAANTTARSAANQLDVEAVALTTQAETLLCLDAAGTPIRPAIVWLDNRSSSEATELGERLGIRTVHASTGQMRSLPTLPASKILWLARHEPATFDRASRFCLIGDWIAARLSGDLVGDITTYSTSLLLDLNTRGWWQPMLDCLGLDPMRLVRLVAAGTVAGAITSSTAAELGLRSGIPFITGAMDTVAGAVGSGNLRPGSLTEATGTYLAPLTCFERIPPFRDPGFPVLLHALAGVYCAVPYGQTAGGVLRWLYDVVARELGGSDRERDYQALIAEAEQVPPGSDGVTFLPHLAGAGFPDWDLSASAAIAGIRLRHGRGHITRAAMEAVSFMLRSSIDGLRNAGAAIDRVTSVGPASRSASWCQIKANVCQLPVARQFEEQASLLGASILAAVATGDQPDIETAAAAMVSITDIIEPQPSLAAVYTDAYERYGLLYRALRPFDQAVFDRQAASEASGGPSSWRA